MEKTVETKMMGIILKTKISDELGHGDYLSREQMTQLGIVPITSVLPEAVKLSGIQARLRIQFSDEHDLETFQVENHDNGIHYLQNSGPSQIMGPPKDYLVGVRNKTTKQVLVPAEYQYIDIIDGETLLINNFLVIPIKYIDGSIDFVDNHHRNTSLNMVKPSEVIFKIMSTKDYYYAIERDNIIVLIKAENIYQATLQGYTLSELEKLELLKQEEAISKPKTRRLWP